MMYAIYTWIIPGWMKYLTFKTILIKISVRDKAKSSILSMISNL
jgi:hypothetical protein